MSYRFLKFHTEYDHPDAGHGDCTARIRQRHSDQGTSFNSEVVQNVTDRTQEEIAQRAVIGGSGQDQGKNGAAERLRRLAP